MIPYSRDPHQTIPASSVKIIGLGGAGTNMLERIALDGLDGAELLALNTDIRTLGACLAKEKIQLGVNLTKGLGAGGDPELGHQAVMEAENEIREAVKDRRIVFLCTGLGGGTGSGAAPIVTRIAREEGAFVVVFATMPFAFEGRRRREQAETALNELAVLSNALVTFDNNRMGELVLAKQGIHEAFGAADHMISESIKAVIRLVVRPGLINVGLDDLMSALRTNRSRCLFGSGLAEGKDRASKALRNALSSPLLDQGSLLKEAQTVLVHLCGGEDLTLFEIELLMQRLQKFVPDSAHVLFGAAVDPAMGDSLSLTLISALPEDSLSMAPRESLSQAASDSPLLDPSHGFTSETPRRPQVAAAELAQEFIPPMPDPKPLPPAKESAPASNIEAEAQSLFSKFRRSAPAAAPGVRQDERPFAEPDLPSPAQAPEIAELELDAFELPEESAPEPTIAQSEPETQETPSVTVTEFVSVNVDADVEEDTEGSFDVLKLSPMASIDPEPYVAADPDPKPIETSETSDEIEDLDESEFSDFGSSAFSPIPKKRPAGEIPWNPTMGFKTGTAASPEPASETPEPEPETPKLKLGVKAAAPQSELSLDSSPRGRFEGENPNVFDGEDLDLPPFLRKKK